MTYLQPISPQEFLLKIPVQTITVVVTRSAFWTAKTWLCVILDSLMEFVGFSQQVRKFLKVQAKKKNLWNQFNEFYIKMSFLNKNSDYGKYTSKKKILWNWFISFDEFFGKDIFPTNFSALCVLLLLSPNIFLFGIVNNNFSFIFSDLTE